MVVTDDARDGPTAVKALIENELVSFPIVTSLEEAHHELDRRSRFISGAIAALQRVGLLDTVTGHALQKDWAERSLRVAFRKLDPDDS